VVCSFGQPDVSGRSRVSDQSIPMHISSDNWAHIASVTWRGEC
jgi:hypothetical protein